MATPEEMNAKLRELERQSAEQEQQLRAAKAEWDEISKVYGETTEAAQRTAAAYWQIADSYRRTRDLYDEAAKPIVRSGFQSDAAISGWGVSMILMVGITALALSRRR